jgi:hypothetical protein
MIFNDSMKCERQAIKPITDEKVLYGFTMKETLQMPLPCAGRTSPSQYHCSMVDAYLDLSMMESLCQDWAWNRHSLRRPRVGNLPNSKGSRACLRGNYFSVPTLAGKNQMGRSNPSYHQRYRIPGTSNRDWV